MGNRFTSDLDIIEVVVKDARKGNTRKEAADKAITLLAERKPNLTQVLELWRKELWR